MKKAKKEAAKSKSKTKSVAKNTKVKAKVRPKARKAKSASKGMIFLNKVLSEIERISSRLDHLEKDVRNLRGVAYPMG